ncbi:hypothetical protein ZWY2020_049797 [Hordeum vulgare]|nr:hypothetical protein ZWY2020_049797 [Hordeum vulgare]
MVLTQLGGSLSRALARMTNATVVDCLNEITRALLQADVQFNMVRDMQASVKRAVYLGALAAGTDKRRVIKTIMSTTTWPSPRPLARTRPNVIFDELCNMLDAGKPDFAPEKGKPCVVMFVGLQGQSALPAATLLLYVRILS